MTTENLDIRVRERGAKKTATSIKSIGTAARTANKGIALMTAGIAGIAAIGVARKVIGLANTFQQLENQVRVAVGSTGDLTGTMDSLFSVADKTRAPIEAIVQLYQRGALAADELGASQKDLIDFTETVGTALALQGGSAEQASGALLQLSQSLGSGIVRAEEFNSILEGAFPIAKAAAAGIEETGGSVAKLRQLIVEGKITSDVFFKGILSQSKDLKTQFAATETTVTQALQRIKNNFIQAAGSGNLDPLVEALEDMADTIADPTFQKNFGTFVSGVASLASFSLKAAAEFGELGDMIGGLFAGQSLEDQLRLELEGVQSALNDGFFFAPIRYTFTGDEELEAKAKELQAQIDAIEEGITGVSVAERKRRDAAAAEAGGRSSAPVSIDGGGGGVDEKLLSRQNNFIDSLKNSNAELEIQARLGDASAAALERYRTEQEIIALQLGPQQAAQARQLTEAIIQQNQAIEDQAALQGQADFIENLEQQERALQIQADAGDNSAEALRLYNVELQAAATGAGPEFVKLALDIAEGINEQERALRALAQARSDQDVVADLTAEAELIGLSNRDRAIEIELRRLSADATQDQIDKVKELAGALFDENESLRRSAITFDEFLKENARAIQQTLSGALSNALTDGFDDLPSQFAKVLQQLASQYLASGIFKALSSIGQGDGASGLAKGIGDFFAGGFATGGDFQVPGTGGTDSQLVSFKATPGESVSVRRPGDKSSDSAPAPQVNVGGPTIVNAIDPSDIVSAFNDGGGDKVILNMISVRQSAFKRALGV